MSFFLKFGHNGRHKKYRYHTDKPINFNQVRRELLVALPPEITRYEILAAAEKRGKR